MDFDFLWILIFYGFDFLWILILLNFGFNGL